MRFGKVLSLSVALLILSMVAPLPSEARFLIVLGLAVGWAIAASRLAVKRFGRKALVVIAAVLLSTAALVGRAYWLDEPNRRLVAQIEQLPGCYTTSAHGLLAGKVEQVYINSKASDRDIARFTELSGLDDLRILVVLGFKIFDWLTPRLG